MDVGVDTALAASEGTDLFVRACRRRSLISGTQKDNIVVSWINPWGMVKVYLLDFTLAYILDHAVCCASPASLGPKLAFHYMKPYHALWFLWTLSTVFTLLLIAFI